MTKRVLKAGDIVRVARCPNVYHGLKFGALARIRKVYDEGDVLLEALDGFELQIREGEGWEETRQFVEASLLKYAKQANHFDQRRG